MTLKHAVCETCGSLNVTSDALARWDIEHQEWRCSSILDNSDCDDCCGETTVKIIELSTDDPICKCQNCDWRGLESHLKEIKHFHERVAPGETCPAGECPHCGAVAHVEPFKHSVTMSAKLGAWLPARISNLAKRYNTRAEAEKAVAKARLHPAVDTVEITEVTS